MKRLLNFLVVFLLILSSNVLKISAIGLGIYVTYGQGNSIFNFENNVNYINSSVDYNASYKIYGLGGVFDTKIAKKGIFNYRLNLGYEYCSYEAEAPIFQEMVSNLPAKSIGFLRGIVDNTFGLAIISNQDLRFWIGPTIRLIYQQSLSTDNYLDFGIGLGGIIGVNWHTNRNISICGELGYRSVSNMGGFIYPKEYYYEDGVYGYTHNDNDFFGKVSLIFKINDKYGSK